MTTLTGTGIDGARRDIGSQWGWFLAMGVALVVLGVLAFFNLPTATKVSVYTIGILMLLGAGAQLATAFVARGAGSFVMLLLSAILYGVAGYFTFANPDLAAKAYTVVLAATMIASGALRIGWSLALRALGGWGWSLASGVVSIIAGAMFLAQWPADATWLLGMVLAVDLTFQGAMAVGFGLALREIAK